MPKFYEIKMFPHCSWRCDVSWKYLENMIVSHSERGSGALDLEPDFQRAHVWNDAQRTAYIEYILRGGTSGKELYFNCPGWGKNYRGPYVIVDGKQRLEAVRRFMRGEIKAFGYYRHEYEDAPDITSAKFSWNVAALETRREVLEWYLNFNAGGSAHTSEELERVRKLLEKEL